MDPSVRLADSAGPHLGDQVQFCISGIYPHLAATSQSYTEAGIGAVVPWAGKLWYVSYVAHIVGEGVGLYEIGRDLSIRKRPESVVGTHAGRLVHKESNQLFIGPYVIDAAGQVRVIDGLVRERITAYARHLFRPEQMVYAQAMEGKLYEVDVRTLEVHEIVDLSKEALQIEGRAHFKGAYTSQGRLVVANNTYDASDAVRGYGGGRLAEWDGKTWRVIKRTAYCDVTTAAGVWATPGDPGPLWAIGWDRDSVLLSVLADGSWSHYRLPKASQSHDHAWCTEWPRIQRVLPRECLVDMHGMFFRMRDDFQPGRAHIEPYAAHLRIVPDMCLWEGRLVLAGNQNSAMSFGSSKAAQPRHRTGGQPQSNSWFGTVEELAQWGEVHGWGASCLRSGANPILAPTETGWVVSEPLLIGGYRNRTFFLWWDLQPNFFRCTDQFPVEDCPPELAALPRISVRRGDMNQPGVGYSFVVNRPVVIYLAVHERGDPSLPSPWKPTSWRLRWWHGELYTDRVCEARFPAGKVVIPEHRGRNEQGHFGVPHLCFIKPADRSEVPLQITELPEELGARLESPEVGSSTPKARIFVEVDRDGSGVFTVEREVELLPGQVIWWQLSDQDASRWVRLRSREALPVRLYLCAVPAYREARRKGTPFAGLRAASEEIDFVHGAALPLADALWIWAFREKGSFRAPIGLFRVDYQLRAQLAKGGTLSPAGETTVAWNRQMVGSVLGIGPYLVDDRGEVRRIQGLPDRTLVATVRHPGGPERCYILDELGTLHEVDIKGAAVVDQIDVPQFLGLDSGQILFRAGHQVGSRLIVAGIDPSGTAGILAEGEGTAWKVVDTRPFVEVCNLGAMSEEVVAIGWDRASAVWLVRGLDGRWELLRFPKASHVYEQTPTIYRPRIREVETERVLVDCHGFFYEVSGLPYARSIVPVCTHGLALSDFASFRGLLTLVGAPVDGPTTENLRSLGPLRLWLGKTDDLWQLPEPRGYGGPWHGTAVRPNEPSEPFLIYGFRRKELRLRHNLKEGVSFTVEVDPTVHRRNWVPVGTVDVAPGQEVTQALPDGLSAHWIRLRCNKACIATAQLELGP
ncbi:MAG: hypothetical protein NZ899_12450 [Thermoguttaceae bacterium]|nr:hypothetical protein [Thermoguttaceae bacterium]MDW8078471.1 hypothetical protein [Thermoguttaceae bacterium]